MGLVLLGCVWVDRMPLLLLMRRKRAGWYTIPAPHMANLEWSMFMECGTSVMGVH